MADLVNGYVTVAGQSRTAVLSDAATATPADTSSTSSSLRMSDTSLPGNLAPLKGGDVHSAGNILLNAATLNAVDIAAPPETTEAGSGDVESSPDVEGEAAGDSDVEGEALPPE